MSGLGIDFGSNEPEQQRQQQQRRPPSSQRPRSSYASTNPTSHPNNINLSKRPVSSSGPPQSNQHLSVSLGRGSSANLARRVRIASGEPNVMGHGVGHVEGDYIMSPPESQSQQASLASRISPNGNLDLNGLGMFGMGLGLGIQGYGDGQDGNRTNMDDSSEISSITSVPKDRNKRLSLAVKAMGSSSSNSGSTSIGSTTSSTSPFSNSSSSGGETPSSSNGNESSSSQLKSAMKGSKTLTQSQSTSNLRKQSSQPNLSRSTTIRPATGMPPPQRPTKLGHSKSAMSLGSLYSSSEGYSSESGNSSSNSSGIGRGSGASSLGRSTEIGRGGTRRGNQNQAQDQGQAHVRSMTWDGGKGAPQQLPTSIPPATQSNSSSTSSKSNSNPPKVPIKVKPEDLVNAPTSDSGEQMIPDGFGGYVELSRATSQVKPPSFKSLAISEITKKEESGNEFELDAVSETDEEEMRDINFSSDDDDNSRDGDLTLTPKLQAVNSEGDDGEEIAFDGNSRALADLSLSFSHEQKNASPPKATMRKRSQSFGPHQDAVRSTLSSGLRVGSFYGPSGEETARLDGEGRIESRSSSPIKALSSEISQRSSSNSTINGRSHGRSQSQSGPIRAKMMSSPPQNAKDDGGARPGTSLGITSSSTLKGGLNGEVSGGPPRPLPNPTNSFRSDPLPNSNPKSSSQLHKVVSMRSAKGWSGLEGAETGGSFVSLEHLMNRTNEVNSGFQSGMEILPNRMSKRNDGEESILLASADPDGYLYSNEESRRRRQSGISEATTSSSLDPKDSISNVGVSNNLPQRKELRLQGGPPMRRTASSNGEPTLPSGFNASHGRSISMSRSQSVGAPPQSLPSAPTSSHSSNGNQGGLDRHPTLISTTSNPARRSRELNRLLGNSGRKLNSSSNPSEASTTSGNDSSLSLTNSRPGSALGSNVGSNASSTTLNRSNAVNPQTSLPPAVLEQAKASKARVQVDLVLESDLVVEGGILRGRMEVKVRNGKQDVMLAQPKIRVVGFEELLNDDTRHIFYHHASVLDGDKSGNGPSQPYILHGSPTMSSPQAEGKAPLPCFGSSPDDEGYCVGKKGTHSIPFALEIPIGKGAKGSYRGKNALVRYIVIGSVKLKNPDNTNRSIAHFYRHVELFPYLNPAVVLSSAPRPVTATASKGLFLGGSGKVHLTASLHRATWVAGQRVHINVGVLNETSKKVKSLTLSLIRTVTLFRPRPDLNVGRSNPNSNSDDWNHNPYVDQDACNTSTSRKKIGEETLEMGQKGSKGVVTAKGWWTGVEAGGEVDFSHYMCLPMDALSISRGRHVEVLYSVKVSVSSSLSSDVSVELPLRVINFVSLDPPPNKSLAASSSKNSSESASARNWSQAGSSNLNKGPSNPSRQREEPLIERVRTAEQLRSPGKVERMPLLALQKLSPLNGLLSLPNVGESKPVDIEAQRSKRLQHQKSLDFINHAIRSATARKAVTPESSPPMGLGIEIAEGNEDADAEDDEEDEEMGGSTPLGSYSASVSGMSMSSASTGPTNPSCLPYVHGAPQATVQPDPAQLAEAQRQLSALQAQERLALGLQPLPAIQMNSISLDDVGDDYETSDDEQEPDADKTLNLNDDSVDEVDMVVGSARLDEESSPMFRKYSPRDADESFDSVSTTRGIREELEEEDEEEKSDDEEEEESRVESDDGELNEYERNEYEREMRDPYSSSPRESPYHLTPQSQSSIGPSPRSRLSPHAPIYRPTSPASASPAESSNSRLSNSDKPITAKVSVFSRDLAVKAGANLTRTKTLHKSASNLDTSLRPPVNATSSIRAGTSSSGSSSGGSRPTSPVKPSAATASPTKSALKNKSSFTFATANSPIKSGGAAASKAQEISEAPRAKVNPSQLPKAKPRASNAGSVVGSRQQSQPSTSTNGASNSKGGRKNTSRKSSSPNLNVNIGSKNGTGSGPSQQNKRRNHRSRSKKNSTSPSMASETSGGSSPSSSAASLATPEMDSNVPLPSVVGIDAVGEESMEQPHLLASQSANYISKSKSQTQLSVLSTPTRNLNSPSTPTQALRHSASAASLTGDRLQRSHSTHNLRGAAVILPSVRNKIAMLESRKQMLKDFVGNAGEESPSSASATGTSTPTRTPTKSGNGGSSTPNSEGRVAALGAAFSAEASANGSGSPLRSGIPRRESSSSLTPSSGGRLNLQRQGSVASSVGTSVTDDSTNQPSYLRRMPSTMSFKAPVLRSVKESEKSSVPRKSNGPNPVKIGR